MDSHSDLFELLTGLLVFFAISGCVIPLLRRAKLSPVLGYLLAGMVIGPYGIARLKEDFDWISLIAIENISTTQAMGELGVIALLFMIGLELSLRRLMELRHYVLGLGSLQILVCGGVIAFIAAQFNNSLEASLVLGLSLALSSTAIVMKLLDERHLMNRPVGVLGFSILLMQDLAVVPILILTTIVAGDTGKSIGAMVGESLLIATIAVIGIYVIGKRILRPLMNSLKFSRDPDFLTAFVVFMVIGCSTITYVSGLSAALGAFLAGLLIAETEFRHEIEVIIEPLKNLLLGLFFLSVGMMIDVTAILESPFWIGTSVVGIIILKAAIIYPLARLFKVARRTSAKVAIILSQPGEFAFLILSVGMVGGVIPQENGQFFLMVTALAMCVTPFLFAIAPKIGALVGDEAKNLMSLDESDETGKAHVVIAGFGRIGQIIGQTLERQQIPYRAMDQNVELVREKRAQGLAVMYGDIRRMDHWDALQAGHASVLILAIDDPDIAKDVLSIMRRICPNLPILMRSKDTSACQGLYDLGATLVVPEALESSLQIARHAMEILEVDEEEIEQAVSFSRNQANLGVE